MSQKNLIISEDFLTNLEDDYFNEEKFDQVLLVNNPSLKDKGF